MNQLEKMNIVPPAESLPVAVTPMAMLEVLQIYRYTGTIGRRDVQSLAIRAPRGVCIKSSLDDMTAAEAVAMLAPLGVPRKPPHWHFVVDARQQPGGIGQPELFSL